MPKCNLNILLNGLSMVASFSLETGIIILIARLIVRNTLAHQYENLHFKNESHRVDNYQYIMIT